MSIELLEKQLKEKELAYAAATTRILSVQGDILGAEKIVDAMREDLSEIKKTRHEMFLQIGQLKGSIHALHEHRRAEAAAKNSPPPKDLKKSLVFTDHALLRYAERRYALDVETLKREMLEELGDVPFKNFRANGYVVKDGVIVTYLGQKKG